jgi:hypothetical protein
LAVNDDDKRPRSRSALANTGDGNRAARDQMV